MKKSLLVAFSALSMIAALAGCGNTGTTSAVSTTSAAVTTSAAPVTSAANTSWTEGPEIALVTDVGNIDDHSFNQACWEGCKDYSAASGKGTKYYRPASDSTAARCTTIETAISAGAKVVVMPGYLFQSAIKIEQSKHTDVAFLAQDCTKFDSDNNYAAYDYTDNTTSIVYQEEQAGFFAGYAAVMEGYRKLGFEGGMAVPAVVRYGEGYCYGAHLAATDLKLADGAVAINYNYSGTFAPDDTIVTRVSGWYNAATEVVFSCGGGILKSVLKAAGDVNDVLGTKEKKVIGVDVDQVNESADGLIITSAMKKLEYTTKTYLAALYKNNMKWGTIDGQATAAQVITKGVTADAVGLPTETASWKLTKYSVTDYNTLYAKVKAGTITVPAVSDGDDHTTSNAWTKVTINYNA